MRLSVEQLREALGYFEHYRLGRIRVFASDTDFETLCRFEDQGSHRFSIALDNPVVRIEPDDRGRMTRILARPRMIDDAAVHARAARAAELLMGSAWRPVALIVRTKVTVPPGDPEHFMTTHYPEHGFLIELDKKGSWKVYTGGLERWCKSHLAPDLERFRPARPVK